jgi:uncharacterized protein (TIRG00374 family)
VRPPIPDEVGPSEPARRVGLPDNPWNRRRIVRGLWLFVALTVAGFLVLFARGTLRTSLGALTALHPVAVLVGSAQVLADLGLGGLRIWACMRALGARVGLGACTGSNAANVFLGGVTPSQSGGGPAQIYILMRAGLSFSVATVASGCTFAGTTVVFLLLALHLTLSGSARHLGAGLKIFSGASMVIFAILLALCILGLTRPSLFRIALRRHLGRLPRFGARLQRSHALYRVEMLLIDYAHLLGAAGRRGKRWLAAALGLSGLIYLNKLLVAWVVLRGLGLEADVRQVLRLQELQYLVLYFAPTPGASGLAEISGGEIMKPLVPAADLGAYLLVWRTFTLYLGMLLGGLVLMRSVAGESHARTRPPR